MNNLQTIRYFNLIELRRSFSVPKKITKALQKAKRAIGRSVRKTFEAIGRLWKSFFDTSHAPYLQRETLSGSILGIINQDQGPVSIVIRDLCPEKDMIKNNLK